MSFVNLVSGGLDSTLVGVMAREDGVDHYPLFIDYGQRAATREWNVCRTVHNSLGLPAPVRMDISGFGHVIVSGLTSEKLHIKDDAFTPGRNLMFLLMGAAYAYQVGVSSVAVGLLAEQYAIFPDQKESFVVQAESAITAAMGRKINLLTPLIEFGKADVVRLADAKGVTGTYSCHTGNLNACGKCIACLEYMFDREQ